MSQIASAYAVPADALPEVQRPLAAGDWNGFWQRIHSFAAEAAFPYSGYVVVVLAEYLRERGIELPVSRDPAVGLLVERCRPLACTGRPGAIAASAALAGLSASDAELAAYWGDFTGEVGGEAGDAMRAALDWLRQVLDGCRGSDWCIILEG